MGIDVRPADERFLTRARGVETRHCFSFGPHYDPAQVGHGPLVVCDEHRLEPAAGFGPHPHRDVEVVTWLLDGALLHRHDEHEVTVSAGGVQRMSAGTGVLHTERAGHLPTRLVQAWLVPTATGGTPSYEHCAVEPERLRDALVPVVSGLGHDGALTLGTRAALHVGRLSTGTGVALPSAARLHLLVARGVVDLDGRQLGDGDSARLTGTNPGITAATPAEVLVWELPDASQQE